MMKKIVLFATVVFLISSCSKDNNKNNNSSDGSWTFKDSTFQSALVSYVAADDESNLGATAKGYTVAYANSLVYTFINPPTSSGQIPITNTADSNTVMVSAMNLSGSTLTTYMCGETNVMANVTINSGKISVSFPGKIWLHNMFNYNDSAQLSVGTITQQ